MTAERTIGMICDDVTTNLVLSVMSDGKQMRFRLCSATTLGELRRWRLKLMEGGYPRSRVASRVRRYVDAATLAPGLETVVPYDAAVARFFESGQ